jgi:hypothetical protein
VLVDGHQEPFVVVDAALEEPLTDPVVPKPEELEELEELELEVVPDPPVVDTATVADWLAYTSARWAPSPPAARVVASRTPAVHRRVVVRARLVRLVVMPSTLAADPCSLCERVVRRR